MLAAAAATTMIVEERDATMTTIAATIGRGAAAPEVMNHTVQAAEEMLLVQGLAIVDEETGQGRGPDLRRGGEEIGLILDLVDVTDQLRKNFSTLTATFRAQAAARPYPRADVTAIEIEIDPAIGVEIGTMTVDAREAEAGAAIATARSAKILAILVVELRATGMLLMRLIDMYLLRVSGRT
jgi:hypothetical protein